VKIVTQDGQWVVLADWLGQERVVYRNADVFRCIAYRRAADQEV
jgi:hypothetical protein